MILELVDQLSRNQLNSLPRAESAKQWVAACSRLLRSTLDHQGEFDEDAFLRTLGECACWSQPMFVDIKSLSTVSETIRRIEVSEPFTAIFDVAVMPRMLAYPSRRRFKSERAEVMGEMFAVPHFDPDRWGRKTGRWIPLSCSAYAESERSRWAQLIVLSPHKPDDPNVKYAEDRFRHLCKEQGIVILDEDPDSTGITRLFRGDLQ
jgi:hypothetical protein